jgi:hypothetical protein
MTFSSVRTRSQTYEDMSTDSETTAAGEQWLVAGVSPVTTRERLQVRMETLLKPRCRQKPLNVGLWDEDARNQMELFGPGGS